jgi:hypothetical protein
MDTVIIVEVAMVTVAVLTVIAVLIYVELIGKSRT